MKVSEKAREFIKEILTNLRKEGGQYFLLNFRKKSSNSLENFLDLQEVYISSEKISEEEIIFFPFYGAHFCCRAVDWNFLSQCCVNVYCQPDSNIRTLQAQLLDSKIRDLSIYLEKDIVPLLKTAGFFVTDISHKLEKNIVILFYKHSKNSLIKNYISLIEEIIFKCVLNYCNQPNLKIILTPA